MLKVSLIALFGLSSAMAFAKVNINTATLDELMMLKGIGEVKAQAIIEYREANGDFTALEELTNVSGIGSAIYERLQADLALTGETDFTDVNPDNLKK
ncbi:ComEA family DNA-binding protein [Rappaport israeli]|uniref:ComEA family DNA-binding protein n=1 Tax=Rappaport israeli TaxID=1839807 RepID=UPI000930518A|nr:helix-hairpin-helix domain-containing protein [Rappaport israeli]